jgi:hypothetical protein
MLLDSAANIYNSYDPHLVIEGRGHLTLHRGRALSVGRTVT